MAKTATSGDDLEAREEIVLAVLRDADDAELRTREVLEDAKDYDEKLGYNKQISRVFDDLEERGLVTTRYEPMPEPLDETRVARLTPAGEREAEDVTVTPVAADDLEDLEEELQETRERLAEVERQSASTSVVDENTSRVEYLEEQLEDVRQMAGQAVETAEDAEELSRETVQAVAEDYKNVDARINGLENRLEYLEKWKENVEEVLQDRVRPAVEFVQRNWLNDSPTPAGDGR